MLEKADVMIALFARICKEFFLLQWAKWFGYETLAPEWAVRYRWKKCKACPQFDGVQCTLCQCLVEAKVMLATSGCPQRRWYRIWQKRLTSARPPVTSS